MNYARKDIQFEQKINRIGIFVFYDADGIVDDYIPYLLKDIRKNLSRLIIVCNGDVTPEGYALLKKFSEEILIRENKGYDGGAYRYVLLEYLCREELCRYKELLLFNDTFFGPFYPFSKVFESMEFKDVDMWALSEHGESIASGKFRAAHLQSYFLCIRNKVLRSDAFWDFWTGLEESESFQEAVENFEISFSENIRKAGFRMDAFFSLKKYDSNPKENMNYSQLICGEAIEKYKMPVLKRKNLINSQVMVDEAHRAIQYIETHYNYPVKWIWRYAFRKYDMAVLDKTFGLNHLILHSSEDKEIRKNGLYICLRVKTIEFMEDVFGFLPDASDLRRITVVVDRDLENVLDEQTSEGIEIAYVNSSVDIIEYIIGRPEEWEPYEWVGVFQEEDRGDESRFTRYQMRSYYFRQTLLSEELLDNLQRNSINCMGVFYPEYNIDEIYNIAKKNKEKERAVREFLRESQVELHDELAYELFGQRNFWCQSNFLKDAVQSVDGNGIWYYALPYIAKSMGYGMGYVHTKETAENLFTRFRWGNMQIRKIGFQGKDIGLMAALAMYGLDMEYYLYGCGIYAKRYAESLAALGVKVAGYIVSDGQKKPGTFKGKRVLFFSEYMQTEKNVIFVAVGKKLKEEIESRILERKGYRYVTVPDDTDSFEYIKENIRVLRSDIEKIDHERYLCDLALKAAPFEYGNQHPRMRSGEELLNMIIKTGDSLVRFGDGEFALMYMKKRAWFQEANEALSDRLKIILNSEEGHIHVSIPDILGSLEKYTEDAATNIRDFLSNGMREKILESVGTEREYYDAYVTRPYIMYKDKGIAKRTFSLFQRLWKGKRILLVEGEYVRNGVGNDLFSTAASVKRILCPSKDSFFCYEKIFEMVKRNLDGTDIFLVSLGPTAKLLAYDVALMGIQSVDIGQIDNEYMWWQMGSEERMLIQGRAVPELGKHSAKRCEDKDYNDSICGTVRH